MTALLEWFDLVLQEIFVQILHMKIILQRKKKQITVYEDVFRD